MQYPFDPRDLTDVFEMAQLVLAQYEVGRRGASKGCMSEIVPPQVEKTR